jgi:hypothetical protein
MFRVEDYAKKEIEKKQAESRARNVIGVQRIS